MMKYSRSSQDSLCLPPRHLLGFFVLFILVISYTTHSSYKKDMEETMIRSRLFFMILLLAVFIIVLRLIVGKASSRVRFRGGGEGSNSIPWGVAFILVMVLVMANYHSSVQSSLFRSF